MMTQRPLGFMLLAIAQKSTKASRFEILKPSGA
jgi:hypothetical protein